MRAFLSILVFVCAFALNPAYVVGCGASDDTDDDYKFSGDDMLALAAGATGSYSFTVNGQPYVLKLDLKAQPMMARGPSLFASSAHACGTRQVFPTASACVTSSEIQMAGTLTLERTPDGGALEVLASKLALEGQLYVYGLSLTNGSLIVQGDTVSALLDSDGKTFTLVEFRGEKLGAAEEEVTFPED